MSLWVIYRGEGNPPWKYQERKVTGFAVDKYNCMLYTVYGDILSSALVYASEEEAKNKVDSLNQKDREEATRHRIEVLMGSIATSEKAINHEKLWISRCKAELDLLKKEINE